jgi:hypothetical protein
MRTTSKKLTLMRLSTDERMRYQYCFVTDGWKACTYVAMLSTRVIYKG